MKNPMSLPKAPQSRRMPKTGASHVSFGSGGPRAFREPMTMQAPDQAFGAAMAMPQGGKTMPGNGVQ